MTGKELQDRRERLKLSREKFARELKTSAVTIWRWENERRTIPPHLELALETVERKLTQKG